MVMRSQARFGAGERGSADVVYTTLPVLVEMTEPALARHADLSQFRGQIPPFAE
jgi:hypothetical protein